VPGTGRPSARWWSRRSSAGAVVINSFAEEAAWNNWQGYLLGPLGLGGRDGDWAWANLGVLAALLIGFLVTWIARRGTVARQEGRA
jgi:hypothetical protein